MASADGTDGLGQGEGSYAGLPDTSAAEAALRAKLSRKRTKTGCLTCRKRRIKCGEERPTCRNCVKSKRICEGYSQRVIFKPPSFDYRPVANGTAHATFQSGPGQVPAAPWPLEHGQPIISPAFQNYSANQVHQLHQQPNFPPQHQYHSLQESQAYSHPLPLPPTSESIPPQLRQQYQFGSGVLPIHGLTSEQPIHGDPAQPWTFAYPSETTTSYPGAYVPVTSDQIHFYSDWPVPTSRSDPQWDSVSPTVNSIHNRVSPTSSRSSRIATVDQPVTSDHRSPTWTVNGYVPRPELSQPIDYRPVPAHITPLPARTHSMTHHTPISYDMPTFYEGPGLGQTPTNFLQSAAVETYDVDYYDVQSDEGIESFLSAPREHNQQLLFHQIITSNNIVIQDPQRRRYDTFISEGILDNYRPDEVANPLGNEATARLFLHFIAVTGPSLSMYERQVRNTSMLFTEGQVPVSQQGLWTYTMPVAALRNRGLLHAMLALASLQVARLTNGSATPSLQHYAWALKRIHQSVGDEKRRFKLTTMAGTMLLGFYEIFTADHAKWNTHLSGSKQLFVDTDFTTMTKQFVRLKAERAGRRLGKRKFSAAMQEQDEVLDQTHDVDERVISELSGKEVKYEPYGQILTADNAIPQELDVTKFEILRDLYWWYLKQDAYQSIVSGNPLLLNYSRWTDCPPRAPLGKPDAVYGSFDHLMLLLGRIADFAARDRKRKLKVMESNGGQWRPAAGMKIGRPPQPAPPTPQSTTTTIHPNGGSFSGHPQQGGIPPGGPPAGPTFYGMAPPPRMNAQMPSSYRNMSGIPTPEAVSPQDPIDLHAATHNALEEYARIRGALQIFNEKLQGEKFKPLTADYQPPLETPFGPALFYRSYDIGVLWAMYHTAMIITIRSHPHMHPAAHVAALIAAEDTAFFAKEIGRITAGIVPGPPDQSLNPTSGASLIESCMASFFAAIQYQDPAQRHFTVMRIKSIAQRTGWGSAELIANGCETSWVKAAAAGRGPPYTRVARTQHSEDPRVNGSWEALDPAANPDDQDQLDRRLVPTNTTARLNWAIGVLGTEDDEKTA